jgi:hypothetical protein
MSDETILVDVSAPCATRVHAPPRTARPYKLSFLLKFGCSFSAERGSVRRFASSSDIFLLRRKQPARRRRRQKLFVSSML